MKNLLTVCILAISAAVAGCSISMPFKWTAGNPENSLLPANEKDEVLVVITHATVDPAKKNLFDQGSAGVLDTMNTQSGLIGYSLHRQIFGDEVWTATVWVDEKSMLKFVESPAHVHAVQYSLGSLKNIQYTRLLVQRSELPLSWDKLLKASQQHEDMISHSKLESAVGRD